MGCRCVQILEDGTQCEAWALHGRDKCFSHDSSSAEEKILAVRKGGATRQAMLEAPLQEVAISTPEDIVKLLAVTITEVRAGCIDPRIANTIGFLAGHLIRAMELTVVDGKTEEVKALILHKVSTTPKRGMYD